MKNIGLIVLAAALAVPLIAQAGAKPAPAAGKKQAEAPAAKEQETPAEPVALAREGKKNMLPDGGWFTWKFDKKPQLGTAFVKVQIFSKDKKQVSTYEVLGESGMPSMPYHDTGAVKFQLNKKGDYLLPVDVVMGGEWKLVIRIKKDGKELFAGKVIYNV